VWFVKGLKSCSIAASTEEMQECPILGCAARVVPTTIANGKDHCTC